MKSMVDFKALREEYRHAALDESEVDPDPMRQFSAWFEQAAASGLREANAMALATATANAEPSVRMVLLKAFDERGFVFFTNYCSQKGRELAQNPRAALCFYWAPLERQVRITGQVAETTRAESVEYFNSRPAGSRIGAGVSQQSSVVGSRRELELSAGAMWDEYPQGDIPVPESWGGYRVRPEIFEFWQGREDRLHDRVRYTLDGNSWKIERLAP